MTDKTLVRFAVRETLGAVTVAVALMWSAGTMAWWPAWAMATITLLWSAGTAWVIMRTNPDLLAERMGPKKGAASWDTRIMSVVGVMTLARLILAGLDHRYGWSNEMGTLVQVAALVVVALAYALVVWATGSNAFFSQIVRVQSERGHAVATGGPYRWVRHPAYVGTILVELFSPILLGSWWALVPGAIAAALYVVRTAKEDAQLQLELGGYADYAMRVTDRLFPGIW